jgi:hypothetical protein
LRANAQSNGYLPAGFASLSQPFLNENAMKVLAGFKGFFGKKK